MSTDPEVIRQQRRVDASLAKLQQTHTQQEQRMDEAATEIVQPKPRVPVCRSCFVQEGKPHRIGCEVEKENTVASPARKAKANGEEANPDVAALMEIVKQQQAQINELMAGKKRKPRKKKEPQNGQ